MNKEKPMRIFTSSLTNPPRYYASRSYTILRSSEGSASVRVDGKKWDVTEDIEAILQARGVIDPADRQGRKP